MTRQLAVGDVVTVGAGVVRWRVRRIVDESTVVLQSAISSCIRKHPVNRLRWANTAQPVIPDAGPSPETSSYTEKANGSIFIDGACIRGSDNLAATVVNWDTPTCDKGQPSSVGLAVTNDDTGRRFLTVIADGPDGRRAHLSKDSALQLAAELMRLVTSVTDHGHSR